MSSNERRLILKLVRFQLACEILEADHNEAFHYDSGFDGGEFSGPAHWKAVKRGCDALAQRFGFASADVADQIASAVL